MAFEKARRPFSDVGGAARSERLRSIVLSLARRRTCQHRRSLSPDKCWFLLYLGKGQRGCCALMRPGLAPGSAHVAAHVQIPLTRSLFSFSLAAPRRSSTAAAAPPCPIVCGVNRETENNPRKGKISTSPPPNPPPLHAYPPLVVLYLWPKCLGIKSYYFFGK